jgi:uncharacterized protein
MSNTPDRFVWHDLMTTDTTGAKSFYSEVAGWGTQEENPQYIVVTNNGVPLGGMMEVNEEMRKIGVPTHWLPAVGVDNVDETVAKAIALGGKAMGAAMDIPDIGRYALMRDPQGAIFALYAPSDGQMPGHDGMQEKGEFSWHELTTSDYNAAFEFYSKIFGWEKKGEHDMGPMGIYLMFGKGSDTYGGMVTKTAEMTLPLNWLSYIKVADAKATTEALPKLGAKVMNGPMEVPGGDWITVLADPQGAIVAVHSAKR